MSSQDVRETRTEAEQLAEDLQHGNVDVDELRDDIKEHIGESDTTLAFCDRATTSRQDRLQLMGLQKSELENQTAKLKHGTTRYNLSEWRKIAESHKQTCFDHTLHWIIAMEPDETLDRLRNMSGDHKYALFDLERQLLKIKLEEANEKLKLSEDNLARKTSEVDSNLKEIQANRKEIQANRKDIQANCKEIQDSRKVVGSLEDRISNMEAAERNLQQRYDRAIDSRNVAQQEAASSLSQIRDLKAQLSKKESEVADLKEQYTGLQDQSLRIDTINSEVQNKLQHEKTSHEGTSGRLVRAEARIKELEDEAKQLSGGLVTAGNTITQQRDRILAKDAELTALKEESAKKDALLANKEDELRRSLEESARKDALLAQKDANFQQEVDHSSRKDELLAQQTSNLQQAENEIQKLNEQSSRKDDDIARKDAELTRIQGECSRGASLLAQKETELQQATQACLERDTALTEVKQEFSDKSADLVQIQLALEHYKDELQQKSMGIARVLMGQGHGDQEIDSWLPLVNCLQPPVTLVPQVTNDRWWTVAPLRKQNTNASSLARPIGMLESIGLLYGEVIAKKWADDGSSALQTIINCLEVAEVAPIAMVMEVVRLLLTSIPQGNDVETFGFIFGTCQIVSLIRIRWPETDALTDFEAQCQQMLEQSRPDLRLIHNLVAGMSCGDQVTSAFMNDGEIPQTISDIPHMYCPNHKTLLLAPSTDVSCAWALDLHHHTIWLVDKSIGNFVDCHFYRLERPGTDEHIMVPAWSNAELDFIVDHL